VNLVTHRPVQGALHIWRGDVVAPVHFVARDARRVEPQVLDHSSPEAAPLREELRQWFLTHQADQADRSTYRRQARSQQGRVQESGVPPEMV